MSVLRTCNNSNLHPNDNLYWFNMMESYGIKQETDTVFSVFFLIIGLAATSGNCCALYYFYRIDTSRAVSKVMYATFAMVDLLFGVSSIGLAYLFCKGRAVVLCVLYGNLQYWWVDVFGALMALLKYSNLNVICMMSLLRCFSICRPFAYKIHCTKTRCFILTACCFIHPFIVSTLPFYCGVRYSYSMLMGYPTYLLRDITQKEKVEGIFDSSDYLNTFLNTLPTFIPIIVMEVTTFVVLVKLFTAFRSPQKGTTLTLLLLSFIYLATHTPLLIFNVADVAGVLLADPDRYYTIIPSCVVAFLSSSAVNPFVYHLRGKSVFENTSSVVNPTAATAISGLSRRPTDTPTLSRAENVELREFSGAAVRGSIPSAIRDGSTIISNGGAVPPPSP